MGVNPVAAQDDWSAVHAYQAGLKRGRELRNQTEPVHLGEVANELRLKIEQEVERQIENRLGSLIDEIKKLRLVIEQSGPIRL